jgi:dihydropteroate synthase
VGIDLPPGNPPKLDFTPSPCRHYRGPVATIWFIGDGRRRMLEAMDAELRHLWDCGRVRFDLSDRVLIMGVLNVTPDSFSDGGQFIRPEQAVARALEMVEQGADIIDVGGESTRPGSLGVNAEEETRRVAPVIEDLRRRSQAPISIDTCKAAVARRALELGADIVNDIMALQGDPAMTTVVAASGCGVVAMHMKGTPRDMQQSPRYDDVVAEVRGFYSERLDAFGKAGIAAERVLLDPGIGFGKTVSDNLTLLANLPSLERGLRPQLVGVSRKSFIGKVLDLEADERLEGTAAAVAVSVWNGAACVRVHDVREMRRVTDMALALRKAVRED